jgi:hypothetical protein
MNMEVIAVGMIGAAALLTLTRLYGEVLFSRVQLQPRTASRSLSNHFRHTPQSAIRSNNSFQPYE